jgi:acyl dehydratase
MASGTPAGAPSWLAWTELPLRRLLAYAAGIGATQPCYLDDTAPTGVVAHPALCVALEWPVTLALRHHPQLQLPWAEALRGVHAAQDSTFHRPIRPGDRLDTTATLVQIRAITPGALVVTKFVTINTVTAEPVVTSYASIIYRGVPVEGPNTRCEVIPAWPAPSTGDARSYEVPIPVVREAPYIYTECAQILNPIHTERAVALAAGLPDIILHGTTTWALAASHLIQCCAGGEPTRLQRLAGRFAAMVIPGTTLTLRYGAMAPAEPIIPYTVRTMNDAPAVDRGVAVLAR